MCILILILTVTHSTLVCNCMLLGPWPSPSNIQLYSDALYLTVNVNIKIYCEWYTNSDVSYKHSQYLGFSCPYHSTNAPYLNKTRPSERPQLSWVDNSKWVLKTYDDKAWTGLISSRQEHVVGCCEHGNEPWSSINVGKFSPILGTISFSIKTLLHGVNWSLTAQLWHVTSLLFRCVKYSSI